MRRTSQGVSRTSQGVSRTSLSQETKPEMNMLLVMPLSYTGDWETSGRMVKGSDMTVIGLVDEYCVVESTVVVVKDMLGVPLSLTRFSSTEDSSDYNDRKEVLAREL